MTSQPKKPLQADVIFGNNIRLRRTTLGISQEKLGLELGVSFQQIQKYEKGTNRVSASKIVAIAKALSCPVEYLFQNIDDIPSAGPNGPAHLSSRTLRLANRYELLPTASKEMVDSTLLMAERVEKRLAGKAA